MERNTKGLCYEMGDGMMEWLGGDVENKVSGARSISQAPIKCTNSMFSCIRGSSVEHIMKGVRKFVSSNLRSQAQNDWSIHARLPAVSNALITLRLILSRGIGLSFLIYFYQVDPPVSETIIETSCLTELR